tara:strand:+ start:9446 stop:10471 length:1026 start_codon:yes stop_codon:yes gene_type:complete
MKFRAVILPGINENLLIEEVSLNNVLDIGQVLVKVISSGICGAQLQEIAGLKGNAKFMPHMIGHEGCGEVIEVGPGVTNVKIGDRVVMHWRVGTGIESNFPKYTFNNKEITGGKVNTLCEYSVVSENRLTSVDNKLDSDFATLLGCALTTSLGVVKNDAKITIGDRVIIIGVGGVGVHILKASLLAGAIEVYCIDNNNNKNKFITALGGKFIFSSQTTEYNIPKVDHIIDTTGHLNLVNVHMNENLKPGGQVTLLTIPTQKSSLLPSSNILFGKTGVKIVSSQGGSTNPTEDIPRYVDIFNAGKISCNGITDRYDNLETINIAIEDLKSGNIIGRSIIDII